MTDLRQAAARAIARAFACAFAPLDSPDGAEYWRNNQSRHLKEADAVLAALSASIGEDVVEAAHNEMLRQGWEPAVDGKAYGDAGDSKIGVFDLSALTSVIALAARDAALEEAAKVVDEGQETFSSGNGPDRRHLTPRKSGNLAGLSYADAIRALKGGPARG